MKTAFITGASSGFGQATARALAKEGFKIIALARRKERLSELEREFEGQIYSLALDVRDKDAVQESVTNLPKEFQNISVLINNAGLALGAQNFDEMSLEDIDIMVDTNIKGLLYTTRAVLPLLRVQKSAYIINIGSVAGRYAYPGGNVYCGTKAFVRQFSLALRSDLRGSNIKVTNIAPGLAKTEFSQVRFKGDTARANALYEHTKFLSGEDIAKVILSILNLPEHININELELMPVTQSFAPLYVEKN